jgi:hypothetical protein
MSSNDFFTNKLSCPQVTRNEQTMFELYGSNIFKQSSAQLRFIWSTNNTIQRTGQLFTSQRSFQNTTLRIAMLPLTVFINGDVINKDPYHVWGSFWGYEVSAIFKPD